MPGDTRPRELITLLKIAIEEGNDDLAAEIRSDLYREYGMEMNKGGLASLPGYAPGGMLLKDRLAKIDKNIASVRTKPNLFFDLVKQAGFVKKDGSADIKRFNKAAAKVGIDTKDRSASNMNRITKFLNKASTGAYKNVGMFSGKSGLENFASRIKGLIGYYAEKNSACAKKEFWDDAKKLQRKVNKLKISSAEKVKEVARGLKLKWAVPIGTTTTLLTKIGFGKALPVVGHLITTEMGSGELPKEGTQEYEELMQGLNEEDEKGLEVTVPLPTQEKETAPTERFKGGGMADIYDMTRPLGYAEAGEVGPREDIIQKTNEMITYLNARVAEQSFGTEPASRIINDITEERRKENPDYDRLNEMYSEYKAMDDFAMKVHFTDKYDEPEKKGRSEKGFLNRILNTIHDVTMRPKDAEIGYNAGGLASISQMTRPIHMEGGGDPKDRAELEGLLKSLNFSLMLAQGTGTPSFLGGGSSQQIRDLEKQIRKIELMLGE